MEGGTLLCEISEKWGVSGTPPPLSLDPLWLCEELYSDHCHKKNCWCFISVIMLLQNLYLFTDEHWFSQDVAAFKYVAFKILNVLYIHAFM